MTKPTRVWGLGARTAFRTAAELLLHARLADAHAAELRALRRFDPESVHDLRVACRRVRAAIKVFGKKRLRSLDERVEHLQDVLGEVRDLQLRVNWLTVHGRGRLGGHRSRQQLRKRLRDLWRELSRKNQLEPAIAHRIRIAAKKLRYEAELLSDAFELDDIVEALSDGQSALGNLHDADVRLHEVGRDARLARAARAQRRRSAIKARAAPRRLKRVASALQDRV